MTEHIPTEQLLPFLDGELSNSARQRIGSHLESCWTCRRELDRLREHIGAIVDAQNTVFLPGLQVPPPPNPWPSLETRLAAAGRRRFPFYASLLFAALVLIAMRVWFTPSPVSASVVLQRTSEIDAHRMQAPPGHFVRQKVRVTKGDRRGTVRQSGAVDSWRSPRGGYWRVAASDAVAVDLQERYRRRGIEQHPLSAVSFQSWSANLDGEGLVVRSEHAIDVSFTARAEPAGGELRNVTLRVRPDDWRITGMRLEFGDAEFEIAEEYQALLPASSVPADVLARLEPKLPREERIRPADVPAALPLPAPAPVAAVEQIDLDAIEMDVLYTLHQLGADLGEPITVARGAAEILVQAWSASPARRDLLGRVFQDKLHVRLQLEPPPAPELVESAPLSRPRSSAPNRNLRSEDDERLVKWFGGSELREEFGRSVLVIANDVLARAYALQELANRWPPESELSLQAGPGSQLRTMLREHIHEASQRSYELRLVMKPLLDEFVRNEPSPPAAGAAGWRDSAAVFLGAAKELDLLLRSQFTASDTVVPLTEALAGVQRALASAETALSAVKVPAGNE